MKIISPRPFLVLIAAAAGLLLLGSTCKLANKAPAVPTLTGPTTGVAGVAVSFKATSTDPESDSLQFQFDWGNSAAPVWSALVASGDTVTVTNTYTDSGAFTVKARSKDSNGKESDWSAGQTLSVLTTGGTYPDRILDSVAIADGGFACVVSPDGQRVFVGHASGSGLDFITPILVQGLMAEDTVQVGTNPFDMVASRDGSKLFVSCMRGREVTVLSLPSLAVSTHINVSGLPAGLALSADGHFLLVGVIEPDRILVIRVSDNTVVDSVDLGSSPYRLAVDATRGQLVAALTDSGLVVLTADSAPQLVRTERFGGRQLFAIATSPDGAWLCASSPSDSGVIILNMTNWSLTRTVNLHDPNIGSVRWLSDNTTLVASRWDGAVFVDSRTGSIVDSVILGDRGALAWSPSGESLYYAAYRRVYVLGHSQR